MLRNNKLVLFLISIVILMQILIIYILGGVVGYYSLPCINPPAVDVAKEAAYAVWRYMNQLADVFGVKKVGQIYKNLAEFKLSIEQASTEEEVARVVLEKGQRLQRLIFREYYQLGVEELKSILQADPFVKLLKRPVLLRIYHNSYGEVKLDASVKLDPKTIDAIRKNKWIKNLWIDVELEVGPDSVKVLTPFSLYDRVMKLEEDIRNLIVKLRKLQSIAGYAELEGSGIRVEIYDALSAGAESQVVHDTDIRDFVNEMFSAGAIGIEVGGQRLVVNSYIRCAGPTVVVNGIPISVNPVVVKVVGNPDVLENVAEAFAKKLQPFGLDIKIEKKKRIRLSAYKNSGIEIY